MAFANEELAAFLENLINVEVGTAKPMQSPSLISLDSKMVETGNALQMLGLRRFIEATPTSAAETTQWLTCEREAAIFIALRRINDDTGSFVTSI